MFVRTYGMLGRCVLQVVAAIALLSGAAHAQTVSLPAYEDTTLQGGIHENTNFGNGDLVTRAANDPTWTRRALLKFDTHTTIPAGTTIRSATLTVTVKGGNTEKRTLTASCVPESFWEHETTWNRRNKTLYWTQPGGTMTHEHTTATVSGVVGSTVTFDVTALVQEALGKSSRYTRLMLTDGGADSKGSLRYYHSNEATNVSQRPVLVVTWGSAAVVPPVEESGSTLRVLHWNIASTTNVTAVADFVKKFQPDLVSLNEVYKYSTDNRPQKIADLLTASTGQTWYHHWVQIGGLKTGVGVAVLSRYAIEATDMYLLSYTRSAALIRVNVNGRLVHFVSTHLDHKESSKRLTQVRELKSWLTSFAEDKVVAGDFNWYPGTTEINEMAKTYNDAWAVAKSQATATSTADNPNGYTRNTRIDYVFFSKTAANLTLLSAQTTERVSVSDHRAVLAVFKVN